MQMTLTDDGARVRSHNFNLDYVFSSGYRLDGLDVGDPSFRLWSRRLLFDDVVRRLLPVSDEEYASWLC